jgi:hypothetical protein
MAQVVEMRVRYSGSGARGRPDDIEVAAADLAASAPFSLGGPPGELAPPGGGVALIT